MEVDNGFIVGVYNYCDRWCERCVLSSRCRVFAEEQQLSLDLPMPIETAAERLLDDWRSRPPGGSATAVLSRAEGELPEEFFDSGGTVEPCRPPELSLAEMSLEQRARHVGLQLRRWHTPDGFGENTAVQEAIAVVRHFAMFLGAKMNRALVGRADGEHLDATSDATGSAKAALLALDQLGEAWLRLAEHGVFGPLEAEPILSEVQRLTQEVEVFFPFARRFVRPGFDEPDEVALLELRERG